MHVRHQKSGESVTAPHLRPPSFRKEHAQKGIKAVMASRGRGEEVHEGDVFFVYDAGKMGPETTDHISRHNAFANFSGDRCMTSSR